MRGVRLGCVATRIAGIVGGTTRIRAVLISLATLSSSYRLNTRLHGPLMAVRLAMASSMCVVRDYCR
jgi:hypothetical protein